MFKHQSFQVRLHMQNNHRDYTSQPVDQISPEMQLQWNALMEQCFPEHAKVGMALVTQN